MQFNMLVLGIYGDEETELGRRCTEIRLAMGSVFPRAKLSDSKKRETSKETVNNHGYLSSNRPSR